MASTPPNNEAFLREVDEELRRDQLNRFGKRWGIALIGVVVAALIVFGGWLWWDHKQTQKAEAESETLAQVFRDLGEGRPAGAEDKLKPLMTSDFAGQRAAAMLATASLKITSNDTRGAIAQYQAVAKDETLPKPYRDLALVRQTMLEYDTLKPQDVIARLKPLAVAGNPWFGTAGEMTAVAHLNMNRRELAGPLFAAIAKDEGVPESIRQRAVQMAGVLGVDAVAQADGKAN